MALPPDQLQKLDHLPPSASLQQGHRVSVQHSSSPWPLLSHSLVPLPTPSLRGRSLTPAPSSRSRRLPWAWRSFLVSSPLSPQRSCDGLEGSARDTGPASLPLASTVPSHSQRDRTWCSAGPHASLKRRAFPQLVPPCRCWGFSRVPPSWETILLGCCIQENPEALPSARRLLVPRLRGQPQAEQRSSSLSQPLSRPPSGCSQKEARETSGDRGAYAEPKGGLWRPEPDTHLAPR